MPDPVTIGVIGAGTMGSGIAHVAAEHGLNVILCDVDQATLERSLSTITKNMERAIQKGTRTAAEVTVALERVTMTEDYAALGGADFIVEAVREDLDTKMAVLSSVDEIVRPDTPLASNTSSISITSLAAAAANHARVIGMHFMNPVHRMSLVEVVRGLETSEETVKRTLELARTLGKTPMLVSDSPGFVSNRLLMPMINEAAMCLLEGVGTRESIDKIMELGMNHRMGPLALADLIGLDVCLQVMEVLHSGFGDSKYRPCPLLRRMVDAGHLGRKSGRGFYTY